MFKAGKRWATVTKEKYWFAQMQVTATAECLTSVILNGHFQKREDQKEKDMAGPYQVLI